MARIERKRCDGDGEGPLLPKLEVEIGGEKMEFGDAERVAANLVMAVTFALNILVRGGVPVDFVEKVVLTLVALGKTAPDDHRYCVLYSIILALQEAELGSKFTVKNGELFLGRDGPQGDDDGGGGIVEKVVRNG